MNEKNNKNTQQINRNINPQTTPVIYSDDVMMTISPLGLVLDFGQRLVNTNQVQVTSRIGMSREHAKKFINELSKLVAMTEGQLQTSHGSNN